MFRIYAPSGALRVPVASAARAVFLPALMLCLALVSCSRPVSVPATDAQPVAPSLESRARAIVAAMTTERLVGQTLMVSVQGIEGLSEPSRAELVAITPGAILLFGFNIAEHPGSVTTLCNDIRAAASVDGLSPFVAIDHEGGAVYRFKGGLTRLPSAKKLGAAGEAAAIAAGRAAGSELRALGITMNLAPVVEAVSDANRAFLVDRAWSADTEAAGILSGAFIESCQAAGAAAVAKHFPGNASADPHVGLPVINASLAGLGERYYGPFKEAIRRGASSVMLSHAMVPALDSSNPVSLSPASIAALKEGLRFGGIVMTDDLVMAALSKEGGVASVAVSAMAAGADMLMISGGRAVRQAQAALLSALASGSLPRSRLEDAAYRIVRQKLRFGLDAQSATIQTTSGFAAMVENNGARLYEALRSGR